MPPPHQRALVAIDRHPSGCSSVCHACTMHRAGAPRLYHGERTDGTGSSLQNMMHTAAYAAWRGWNYGGIIRNKGGASLGMKLCGKNPGCGRNVITTSQRLTGHAQPFDPAVELFLGSASSLIHDSIAEDPATTTTILLKQRYIPGKGSGALIAEMMGKLQAIRDRGNMSAVVMPAYALDLNALTAGTAYYDEFYSVPYRAALRASAACALSRHSLWHFRPDRPAVAIHIRRGDVNLARHPGRFTNDSYYYGVVEVIRQHLPTAEFHVFSSTRDQFRRGERNHSADARPLMHTSESFDGFRKRGMIVHLDGDANVASAHFMVARVLVLAKSSFSWAPAVYNPHCVVYHSFSGKPLSHWANADTLSNLSRTLPSCIAATGLWRSSPGM